MSLGAEKLSSAAASAGAPGWRLACGRLHLVVDCDGFPAAVGFVNQVARLAEERNHHPEVDLRYNRVHLALSSHDAGGVTAADVDLATAITDQVEDSGFVTDTNAVAELELAIDTMDARVIRPFWAAVFGYPDNGDDLVDPLQLGPNIWFQQMHVPRPQRNRIHFDLCIAHDQVADRMAAALAAGGHLVSEESAPSFWVLGDAEGNEVCLCTWQNRA